MLFNSLLKEKIMTALEKDILNVLENDARISHAKIAAMLSVDESVVKDAVLKMEADGVIVKYTAIINNERAEDTLDRKSVV